MHDCLHVTMPVSLLNENAQGTRRGNCHQLCILEINMLLKLRQYGRMDVVYTKSSNCDREDAGAGAWLISSTVVSSSDVTATPPHP